LFERGWPRLWPATGILGLFLALALFDAFVALPWTLHAFILSAVVTGTGLCLYRAFAETAMPGWRDAARKVERDSGLVHRPISEGSDRLLAGSGDATAEALWRLHLAQRLGAQGKLKLKLPNARALWAARDPYLIRFAVLALLLVGVAVAGGDTMRRLSYAFGGAQMSGGGATLDAWIDPPPYTGQPPVYLTENTDTIAVPQGSRFNMRVHNATRAPGAAMAGRDAPKFSGANGEYTASGVILRDGEISVRANGATIGQWRVKLIPDAAPSIAFTDKPQATERKAVKFSYRARDDYGVTAVRAILKPRGRNTNALVVDLTVGTGKDVSESAFRDLTAHPFAGLEVDVVLEAQDAAGHKVQSKPERFKLPARVFTNPLARALIELRQRLATDGFGAKERVTRTLEALTLAPDKFYPDDLGVYLALRTAYWGIANAAYSEDVQRVQDLLWETAVGIEQGGLSNLAEELRRLQQMISQALLQGAPQEVIDELLARYQATMQRYLEMMAELGAKMPNQSPQQNSKVLNTEDLRAMLEAIRKMSEAGARAEAQAMMALLQSMLENLHMSQGGEGGGQASPREKALGDAVRGLGELMGKERGLLDKTFRNEPKEGKGIAEEQKKLREDLNKILGGLGDQKIPAPDTLDKAGKSMGDAQGKLGQGNMEGGADALKQTLDNLRKSAEALAKMMQRGQSGNAGAEDPLGRTAGSKGGGAGGIKIPDMSDIERARGILQELRKRAGERGRPQDELDYIDRLLKQF